MSPGAWRTKQPGETSDDGFDPHSAPRISGCSLDRPGESRVLRDYGEIVLEQGSTNPIRESNYQPVGWSLDVWTRGGSGVVPWQTVGSAGSWDQDDELALFYPLPASDLTRQSQPLGFGVEPGVVPSVRLKAYRRGQQDVEYLTLWTYTRHLPRHAVAEQVREALSLTGPDLATEARRAGDADRIEYPKLRPQALHALRLRLGEALSQAHPPAQQWLVDFRPPPRDPEHLKPVFVESRQ